MRIRTPGRRPAREPLEGRLAPTAAAPAPEDNFGQQVSLFVQTLSQFPDQGKAALEAPGYANRGDAISQAERP